MAIDSCSLGATEKGGGWVGGGLSLRPGATAALRGGTEQYPSETVTEDKEGPMR